MGAFGPVRDCFSPTLSRRLGSHLAIRLASLVLAASITFAAVPVQNGPPAASPNGASAPSTATNEAGFILDQVVAVVNGEAITRSAVEDEAWYARFVKKSAPEPALTTSELNVALDRIIEETLLLQAARDFGVDSVNDAAVDEQLQHIRQQAGGEAELERQLHIYQLSLAGLREVLRDQLTILSFLDRRFRPTIRVTERAIASYYRHVFIPELTNHAPVPPLAQVHDKIEALLAEQQRADLEKSFIETLRRAAAIEIRTGKSEQAKSNE